MFVNVSLNIKVWSNNKCRKSKLWSSVPNGQKSHFNLPASDFVLLAGGIYRLRLGRKRKTSWKRSFISQCWCDATMHIPHSHLLIHLYSYSFSWHWNQKRKLRNSNHGNIITGLHGASERSPGVLACLWGRMWWGRLKINRWTLVCTGSVNRVSHAVWRTSIRLLIVVMVNIHLTLVSR